jgi:hypothetical protein
MKEEFPAAASGAMREKLHEPPYDLFPFEETVIAYMRVAEFGAKKYEPWNWSKGLSRVQLIGSLLRHTFAYLRGGDFDKETGLLHTDHILWNAVALSHNVHWSLEDGRRVEPLRGYKPLRYQDMKEEGQRVSPLPYNPTRFPLAKGDPGNMGN